MGDVVERDDQRGQGGFEKMQCVKPFGIFRVLPGPLGDERLSGLQRLLVVRHRQAIAPLIECRVALGDQRFPGGKQG